MEWEGAWLVFAGGRSKGGCLCEWGGVCQIPHDAARLFLKIGKNNKLLSIAD
jgi:hypothetical protein